jgi:MFS family permease
LTRLRSPDVDDSDRTNGNPLRQQSFRWFFVGRLVSLLGSSMTPVALAFAVLEASGRAGDLALVLAAHTIPLVGFVLVGGSVADRFARGTVLRWSNLGTAITQGSVAVLLISGNYNLTLIIILEFLNGALEAFTTPALRGIVPELVAKKDIQKANSLLSSARNATRILGPTAAGILVATIGGGWAIGIDALTFFAAALCMARLDLPAKMTTRATNMFADIRDGWNEFRSTTWVWTIVAGFAVMNCIQVGVWTVLAPAIALDTFGEAAWGAVLSVKAAGVLIMAAAMYRIVAKRLLLVGQIAIALTALPLIALGLQIGVPGLIVAAFIAGMGSGLFAVAWDTSIQEHVPNHMLSRIASYDDFGSYIAIPIGQLAVVPLAVAFGNAQVALVGGILYAVIALLPLATTAVRRLEHDTGADREPGK